MTVLLLWPAHLRRRGNIDSLSGIFRREIVRGGSGPDKQGPIVYPFQSPSAGTNASSDGDNGSGGIAWGRDGEGSTDGYVVGDEASSPAQCLQVSELSVGGEEREGDAEAV